MSHTDDKTDDLREIERWIEQARAADADDPSGVYDEAVMALHQQGDRATFDAVRPLLDAGDVHDRLLAVQVLGQLGVPERTLPALCLKALAARLETESEPTVLAALGVSLGHLDHPGVVELALPLAKHADARVRYGAVHALSRQEDPRAIAALVALSGDVEGEVRNWATFGLGSLTAVDTPALRDALEARLDDPELDGEIRGEALVGLAERGHPNLVGHVQKALAELDPLAVQAAALLGDPALHPQLLALRDHPRMTPRFEETLDEAIARCDPAAEV